MRYTNDARAWRQRFGLTDAQIADVYVYKNLWWELDGEFFGYGDISAGDVQKIQTRLEDGEIFQGWNEHHQSEWQQTDCPMLRITKDNVVMHREIREEAVHQRPTLVPNDG